MTLRPLTLVCMAWLTPLMAAGGCGPGLEPPAPVAAATPSAAGTGAADSEAAGAQDASAGQAGTTGQTAAAGSSGQNPSEANAKDDDAGVEDAGAAP